MESTEINPKKQQHMQFSEWLHLTTCDRNAWILLFVGLLITGFLVFSFKPIEEAKARNQIASICKQMQLNVEARLHAHSEVLKGGAALFDAFESVDRQKWHGYTKQIKLSNNFKGIQGFGFALLISPVQLLDHTAQIRAEGFPDYNVWPDGARDIYTPIIYLEPLEGSNLRALGYDMWSDPVRRAAMEKAMDENSVALTGKVALVQDIDHATPASSILMYVPVYRNGMPIDTVEQRRVALLGWVYSPFRMKDMMQGLIDIPNQDAVQMKIFDGPGIAPSTLLYDSAEGYSSYSNIFSDTLILHSHIGGRAWTLQFIPTAEQLNIDYGKAGLVAVAGSIISLLLFFLICSYRSTHRHAFLIADNLIAELRQSQARYRILVEQSSDAILLFDPQTLAIDEVNQRFCQMLGYSYEQSRQLLVTDIISTQDIRLQLVADDSCGVLKERVFRTRDGVLLNVEVSKSAVRVGLENKVIMTVRDISLRKQAEAERIQIERQLQQAQKIQALGQLTGGIAHDFNNILGVMLGYSNLALTRYATDKESTLARYLEEITTAGERARDLVVRLLAFSRSQTGEEVAEIMEPAPLVEEAIRMFAATIPSGIKLHDQIDDDIPAVCISPGELHQIVMNLVINARDAMVEHGCLSIRLSALADASEFCDFCKQVKNNALCQNEIRGEYVSLSVTDTGCGISQEHANLIFDPFFTTKDVGKGTGLGLSVIQGIVRRIGGCIMVDSHLGMGTTVQVLLPSTETLVGLPATATSSPTIPDGNGARVLVVDDEPALAHYLADMLEGKNYVVDVFTDSVKALNYFCVNPQNIDAVITDQTMPNKSGVEIATVMLALRPDLPVFLCSGYSDTVDENTRLFGIRRFFYKPVSAMELLIALDEEINQPAGAQVS
ncbi:MAG: CHASE domain-containing protein [Methylococcaceae bacterium]